MTIVCVCLRSVVGGGSDADRERVISENEQLRGELRRTEGALKQATQELDTQRQVCAFDPEHVSRSRVATNMENMESQGNWT